MAPTGAPNMKLSIPSLPHLGLSTSASFVSALARSAWSLSRRVRGPGTGRQRVNSAPTRSSETRVSPALTAALSGEVGLGFLQLNGRTGFAYGRAANEDGETVTNKRAWDMAVRLDFDPSSSAGAFLISKVESIFEKKIDLRYSTGAGGKYGIGGGWDSGRVQPGPTDREDDSPERRRVCRRRWSPNGPPAFVSNARPTEGVCVSRPKPRLSRRFGSWVCSRSRRVAVSRFNSVSASGCSSRSSTATTRRRSSAAPVPTTTGRFSSGWLGRSEGGSPTHPGFTTSYVRTGLIRPVRPMRS